jgi:hypothetical protein
MVNTITTMVGENNNDSRNVGAVHNEVNCGVGVWGSNGNATSTSTAVPTSNNHISASLAGSNQGYNHSMDPNAALMMTNAAAAIAAVAAQAVQQIAAHHQQQPNNAAASLIAGLLQGNRNPLLSNHSSTSHIPSHHAALLAAAAANAGHHTTPQGIGASRIASGRGDIAVSSTASSLLRPSGQVLSQHSTATSTSSLTTPAMLANMQTWTLNKLGKLGMGIGCNS